MADAEYVINIAAQLTGHETADELDAITASLAGAGKGSDVYQQAVKRLSIELEAQKVASEQAGAALAAGQDQYRQLEREALRAGKALEKSQGKGVFDARSARDAAQANAALDAYTANLRKLEGESKSAANEQARLQKNLKGVEAIGRSGGKEFSDEIRKYRAVAAAARLLPGPLGRLVSEHAREEVAELRLGKAFGLGSTRAIAAAGAFIAAAAAIAAITIAAVAGYAALAKYAIVQADSTRTWELSREAFAAIGPQQAAATSHFDAVSRATGLTDEALRGLTGTLIDMADPLKSGTIASNDISKALRAAALAEAALGKGGSAQFLARINEGQLSVREFADFAEKKFGPIVEKQLLGLTAQSAPFSNLWTGLFDKIDIDPILRGLDRLLGDLEAGEPLAKAFQFALGLVFNPLSDNAESLAVGIEAAALQIAISLIKMYLAIKPYSAAIATTFDVISFSVKAFSAIMSTAADSVTGLTSALGGLRIGLASIDAVRSLFSDDKAKAAAADGAAAGASISAGTASGIIAGGPVIDDAVTKVLKGAHAVAQEALDSHSPSRVYADLGRDTTDGYTGGVREGTPDAQAATADLVAPPGLSGVSSPVDAQTSAPARASASHKLDLSGASFNFYGVPGAEAARDMFAEALTAILEGDADRLAGAAV